MRTKLLIFAILAVVSGCRTNPGVQDSPEAVDFTDVRITDVFWRHRLDINEKVTIPHAIKKCYDEGRIDNFMCAAGLKEGRFRGDWGFNDSDLYKVLEGMAFSYNVSHDEAMLHQMDTLISYIAGAQEPDGYLYTAWTLRCRDYANVNCTYIDAPYDNIGSSHEFYNMGHMYEAAAAHYIATGQTNFLDIATRNADHIYSIFGPGGREAIPGHEEIEIGLLKLYGVTENPKYLELAKLFLERRGHGLLDGQPYLQDHRPVVEQTEAVGHAVRANYLYTAMADYAAVSGDSSYVAAVDSLWEDVVGRKLYLTGGLGARYWGEAYGDPYELPNKAYAETCAAIAGVFWAQRMFLLHGESKYIDVLERVLYNGLISGISLDGTKFFYPNVLSTEGTDDYNRGGAGRAEWFDCSCCPTNDVRFISSLPGYVYAVRGDDIYVNLYVASEADMEIGGRQIRITQQTDYPWSGDVTVKVGNSGDFDLMLRVPGWACGSPVPSDLYAYVDGAEAGWEISVNGHPVSCRLTGGYCEIDRRWRKGDEVTVRFNMQPRIVAANPKVEADRGKLAVERGPIVYCAESVDNPGLDVYSEPICRQTVLETGSATIEGTEVVTLKSESGLTLVPYYSWSHRGPSMMTVWLNEQI